MRTSQQLPFVFIHGAGGTGAKFRGIEERVNGAPCRVLDLPGHGQQDGTGYNSIAAYADWVNEQLGEEEVIIVGHSMGGMIGIEAAASNPNIKGLVLDASHYEMPVHPKILEDLLAGTFPEFLFKASYGREAKEELLAEEREQLAWVKTAVVHDDFFACNQYKGADTFAKLAIPVLALYGAEDKLLPKGASEKVAELNGNVQTKTIPGAGHYIMLEQPDAFAEALDAFRQSLLAKV
ncbi:alpha/beta hydrolase [Aneurinibacillus sp. BA2021]|nr:alpha/beta hydrolase [Aneurinibacillus sp. BA2021]